MAPSVIAQELSRYSLKTVIIKGATEGNSNLFISCENFVAMSERLPTNSGPERIRNFRSPYRELAWCL